MQRKIEEIIQFYANKHNKPYEVTLAVFKSEYEKLREIMKKRGHEVVKFPSWGKFIVSMGKLAKIDYEAKDARYEAKYGKKDGTQNN